MASHRSLVFWRYVYDYNANFINGKVNAAQIHRCTVRRFAVRFTNGAANFALVGLYQHYSTDLAVNRSRRSTFVDSMGPGYNRLFPILKPTFVHHSTRLTNHSSKGILSMVVDCTALPKRYFKFLLAASAGFLFSFAFSG